jgi:hypothetical protein
MDHYKVQRLMKHMDKLWSWPPTELEAQTVRELDELPRVIVTRVGAERRRYLESATGYELLEGNCHNNCYLVAECSMNMEAVHGWLVDPMCYVRHAVLREVTGAYWCITPLRAGLEPEFESTFEFVADPHITCDKIEHPGNQFQLVLSRKGIPLREIGKMGVRRDPKYFLARAAKHKRRRR